jgi:hypothetical protein
MSRFRRVAQPEKLACGAPCSGAGTLAWRDAEATFDAYRSKVALWIDETIFTMGLPHIDHLGRIVGDSSREAADEQASWGVRRQLRDPNTQLIAEIVSVVQAEFFETVRAGRVCLFHLRGFIHTLTERNTWRMATRRALILMRERLLWDGENLPEDGDAAADSTPEEILLAAEQRLTDQNVQSVIDRAISHLSSRAAAIFRSRTQDPPRPYEEISAELGSSPTACRKIFCEARARVLRVLKPDS